MAKEKVIVDVRDLIMEALDGRPLTWLAEKTGILYDTLYACLVKKHFLLSQEKLDKINTSLKTDFTL